MKEEENIFMLTMNFYNEILEACNFDEDEQNKIITLLGEYLQVTEKNDPALVKADLAVLFKPEISEIVSKFIDSSFDRFRTIMGGENET